MQKLLFSIYVCKWWPYWTTIAFLIIVFWFTGCNLPTAINRNYTKTIDTGYFEIEESDVGRSNPTEWGRMNQWRIILEDDYMGISQPVFVDSVQFTLYYNDDHPEQNAGFWFAAPVNNVKFNKDERTIKHTFVVGWQASVLSCGVFTDLHGMVRLKVKLYLRGHG